MGTSKNVQSPDTPPWRMALAVLGRNDVPVSRQHREIWRSVEAERGPRFADDFSHPTLAAACQFAANSEDVRSTLQKYEVYLSREKKSGFAVEIARRALARAINTREGTQGFARELFAEATSYYVSRDLPSFVGSRGRVESPSKAIALKAELKEITRAVVSQAGTPALDPEGWATYVGKVINGLRGPR